MTRLQSSAITAAAVATAYAITTTTALSLTTPQRSLHETHITSLRTTSRPSFIPRSKVSSLSAIKEKEDEPYFATDDEEVVGKSWPVNPSAEDKVPPKKLTPTPPFQPPPPPKPVLKSNNNNDNTGPSMIDNFLGPILNPTIEKNVPSQVIQGAFLNGVFITFLTSFFMFGPLSISSLLTIVLATNVGIITSYISITEGIAGDFIRSLGRATMEVTDGIMEQIDTNISMGGKKVTPPTSVKEKKKIAKAESPVVNAKTMVVSEATQQLTDGMTAEEAEKIRTARVSGTPEKEEMKPVAVIEDGMNTAEDAEAVRLERLRVAEEKAAAKKKEDESLEAAEEEKAAAAEAAKLKVEQEAKLQAEREAAKLKEAADAKAREEEEQAKVQAEREAAKLKAKAEEEAATKLKAEEEAKVQAEREAEEQATLQAEEEVRARAEEEAKLQAEREAAELKAKEGEEAMARAEEERRLAAEAEQRRLEEQAEAAREAVRLMEEQDALMDGDDDDYDDDMEYEGDELSDEDWEASVRLANELQGIATPSVTESIGGDLMDAVGDELLQYEIDNLSQEEEDALGKAAREAVAKYEEEMRMKAGEKEKVRSSWDDEMVTATQPSEEIIDDIEEDVKEDPAPQTSNVDYSKMTVAELKEVLRSKGLKVSGKKAELIERLESS